ncbi:MAG: BMP family ABC transporter substrate-binding protein [Clostridia bacterium]|nr:BMP family ABC transporter substrate-binding protein [Clostridia bacterium]
MFKKVLSVLLAAVMLTALCLGFASCGDDTADAKGESEALLPIPKIESYKTADDFKIGLICLHDENSTYDANFINALKRVKEAYGLTDDQVLIATGIGEDNNCYEKAAEFANKGCKIVFADSFGHETFMAQAAKEFPNVQFCHATGTSSLYANKDVANLHNAFAAIYEGRYCAGIAAGLKLNEMIKEGKIKEEEAVIGYVGAFTYAEVISGMTSFYLGARSVCPSATMKVRFTGSWYDQSKEQEAAQSLITTDKCVLISQHADSLGAPTACELAGVPNVSYNGSTYSAGKTTFLISSAINWSVYFEYIIKSVNEGKTFDKDWCGGVNEGSVVLSGINLDACADGTKEAIDTAIAAFKAGTLHVFDTSKFTVNGSTLTEYKADVDGDFTGETNVIHDGYFDESNASQFRSAPYFDINIDGVTYINVNYGD